MDPVVIVSGLPNLPITTGWIPLLITVTGALGALWLLIIHSRREAVVVGIATVTTTALFLTINPLLVATGALTEPLPAAARAWIAAALVGVALAVSRFLGTSSGRARLITVIALLAVLLSAANGVNREFDAYPTLNSLLSPTPVTPAQPGEFAGRGIPVIDLAEWHPSGSLPVAGRVVSMHIPPTKSGFSARDALVYLPPAYFANPRPRLPVLVLLAGEPGSPEDWIRSGAMPETMDRFAADHRGAAPVVVVADGTGSQWGNPACVDSREGKVMTYLTEDLHDWAATELTVSLDRAKWAVGGLSYGGTCSLMLATNHPDYYRIFLNMSGQLEPTLGTRRHTVEALFGGDEQAFLAINPMTLMAKNRFDNTAGVFVIGEDDHTYRAGLEQVYHAAEAAGMDVTLKVVPGGHSFRVWRTGLQTEMRWLGDQLGIP